MTFNRAIHLRASWAQGAYILSPAAAGSLAYAGAAAGLTKAGAGGSPGSPTTIWSAVGFDTHNTGDENFSYRNVIVPSGNAQAYIRVTIWASLAAALTVDHLSIGILTGTASDTTATPTPLTFSGGATGSALNGGTLTSDWVLFNGFTTSNKLVVILDISSTGGNAACALTGGGGAGNHFHFQAATDSYNQSSVSGFTDSGDGTWGGIELVETAPSV